MTSRFGGMKVGAMGRTMRRGLRRLLAGIGYGVKLMSGPPCMLAEATGFGGLGSRGVRGSGTGEAVREFLQAGRHRAGEVCRALQQAVAASLGGGRRGQRWPGLEALEPRQLLSTVPAGLTGTWVDYGSGSQMTSVVSHVTQSDQSGLQAPTGEQTTPSATGFLFDISATGALSLLGTNASDQTTITSATTWLESEVASGGDAGNTITLGQPCYVWTVTADDGTLSFSMTAEPQMPPVTGGRVAGGTRSTLSNESGVSLGDPGFEDYTLTGSGWYAEENLPDDGCWTFLGGYNSGGGIAAAGSAYGPADGVDGSQFAWLQQYYSDGMSAMAQTVSLEAGTYTISFLAAQREWAGLTNAQTLQVSVDGNVRRTLTPGSTTFAPYGVTFTVDASGDHTIRFDATAGAGGDNTALIDDVAITTGGSDQNVPAPDSFNVASAGRHAINLSWNGDSSGDYYYVLDRTDPSDLVTEFSIHPGDGHDDGNGTYSFTDTGLDAGTNYSYDLEARDDAGNASDLTTTSATTENVGNTLDDAGFEDYTFPVSGWYAEQNLPDDGCWTFLGGYNSGGGIAAVGSAYGPADGVDGSQFAWLQQYCSNDTSACEQMVNVDAGTYTVNFLAAQRVWGSMNSQIVQVSVGDEVVGTFTPGSSTFAPYATAPFHLDAGMHMIRFDAIAGDSGDNTAFLDDVNIHYISSGVLPELAISDQGVGSYVTSTTPTIAGSAAPIFGDAAEIKVYQGLLAGGTPVASWAVERDGAGAFSYDVPEGVLADGETYTIQAVQTSEGSLIAASAPVTFTVDAAAVVTGMVQADTSPTGRVNYVVTFSKAVTGVDDTAFSVETTGDITGAGVTAVAGTGGAGDTYTVTVNPGSGWGTLRLDLVDTDTIVDAQGNPLGGVGAGNGDFYGPTLAASALQLTVATTQVVEGSAVTLAWGTDVYTPPADTVWEVDWGDGNVDYQTASTPTFSHNYTTGDGAYDVTASAAMADGTMLYTDFIPVTVTPAVPEVTATVESQYSQEYGGLTVDLALGSGSNLVESYDVYISRNGGDYTLYEAGIGRTGGSFAVTGLEYDTDFGFKVVAENAGGASAPATASAETPVMLGASGTLPNSGGYPQPTNLGFTANLYGVQSDEIYIDKNGYVTLSFDYYNYGHQVPGTSFSDMQRALIAPFLCDVDLGTNGSGGTVSYGPDPDKYQGHTAFEVTWSNVNYNGNQTHDPKYDSFSLLLVNRADEGPGDFDIVFEYGALEWDTAAFDSSYAHPAQGGYTNGTRISGTFVELSGSNGGMMAYQNQTLSTMSIRNPNPHLCVQDLSPGGSSITDPNQGILGVVADQDGVATLGLNQVNLPSAPTSNDYEYTVYDPNYNVVGSGALPASGITNFTTSGEGLYTVYMTNTDDASSQSVQFYVATMNIDWNEPNDSNVHNIVYSGTTDLVNCGDEISGMSVEIYTGQRISLYCDTNLPGGKYRWDVGGSWKNFVEDYSVHNDSGVRNALDSNTGKVIPLVSSNFNAAQTSLYAIADMPGEVFSLTYTTRLYGNVVTFHNQVTFNIHKPGQSIWNGPHLFKVYGTQHRAIMNGNTLKGQADWLTFFPATADYQQAIADGAHSNFVQLVNIYSFWYGWGLGHTTTTNDEFWLDTIYPYDHFGPNSNHDEDGGPSIQANLATNLILVASFCDWLMWTPPGTDAIAVPLTSWEWNVGAEADWNSWTGSWALTRWNADVDIQFTGQFTTEFPQWNNKYTPN